MPAPHRSLRRTARTAGSAVLQQMMRRDEHRIVYSSFRGRFSDNPRAIYEELLTRSAANQHVWLVGPESSVTAPAEPVTFGSRAAVLEWGRAGMIVANSQMPDHFRKAGGVQYLQTWHGTPLKRIGLDNHRWADNPAGLRAALADVAKWDYLVSPNSFSTEIFRQAFRYEGEILETGYPRNDLLVRPESSDVRRQARAELGIDPHARVVLYAPTWRDNLVDEHGRYGFSLMLDIPRLSTALGPGHTTLVRAHHNVSSELPEVDAGVIDVTDHPDIRELYLAADVLVTDYSSAMFDFAVTGKPIVLFTYDLDEYRDEVRGFYFDLEQEAPGPICRTSDDVIAALEDLDGVRSAYERAYAAFSAQYCSLEDGGAAARVVDRVFGTG